MSHDWRGGCTLGTPPFSLPARQVVPVQQPSYPQDPRPQIFDPLFHQNFVAAPRRYAPRPSQPSLLTCFRKFATGLPTGYDAERHKWAYSAHGSILVASPVQRRG